MPIGVIVNCISVVAGGVVLQYCAVHMIGG